MPTYDKRIGDSTNVPTVLPVPKVPSGAVPLSRTIDFAKWDTTALAAADIIQLFNIPKGAQVERVQTYIHTAGGCTQFDIGDGDAENGWLNNGTMAVAGVYDDSLGETNSLGKSYYDAAEVITMTVQAGTYVTGKITVVCWVRHFPFSLLETGQWS